MMKPFFFTVSPNLASDGALKAIRTSGVGLAGFSTSSLATWTSA